MTGSANIDELVENFGFLDDWEDRYRYLIELGRALAPLEDAERNDVTKVRGCASQVWVVSKATGSGPDTVIELRGDSDAHLVKGLIAVVLALFSGRTAREILSTDEKAVFKSLGLKRSSDAATLERPRIDGAADQARCACGVGRRDLGGCALTRLSWSVRQHQGSKSAARFDKPMLISHFE